MVLSMKTFNESSYDDIAGMIAEAAARGDQSVPVIKELVIGMIQCPDCKAYVDRKELDVRGLCPTCSIKAG